MKNVLIITTVSGFLEKFEKNNVKILQDMGYTVHYAANMNEQQYLFDVEKLKAKGVILHHIDIEKSPYMLRNNFKSYRQLTKIIKDNNIALIHCHTPVGGFLGRLAGFGLRKKRLKIIYTAHGFHFYKGAPFINETIYQTAERLMSHKTDVLVVINAEDYQYSKTMKLRKGGKVYHIPGVGLDLEYFQPLSKEDIKQKRCKLALTQDEFMIVSVGELNENKNQRIILEAMQKLIEENPRNCKIKYFICGDGFFSNRIDDWIGIMKLEDNVIKCGYQKDVRQILGCADALVFPSKREGLGMVGLEALAMGVPAIVADNRGTREYIVNQHNGYVCKHNTVQEYIDNIKRVMERTPEQKEAMKKHCLETVKGFEQSKTNNIMQTVYREVAKL